MKLGLIGAGIQRSRSPALHEHEAAAQGLRLTYELIDLDPLGMGVEALPRLLADAKRRGFAGLNITYPCKQAVIALLSARLEDATDGTRPDLLPRQQVVEVAEGGAVLGLVMLVHEFLARLAQLALSG